MPLLRLAPMPRPQAREGRGTQNVCKALDAMWSYPAGRYGSIRTRVGGSLSSLRIIGERDPRRRLRDLVIADQKRAPLILERFAYRGPVLRLFLWVQRSEFAKEERATCGSKA